MQVKITVSGRVQGVSFRAYTSDKAKSLGLAGTARNLPTGEVEIHALGNQDVLDGFVAWCWQGSPFSKVDNVITETEEENASLSGFHISYR